MCEQTEIDYLDGEVVWVKLGSYWWPGEVISADKLPPDVLPSFRKPPIAVVKFFQEDTYEYVRNINSIYKYNCSRKNEFIKKGLDVYRSKHGTMDKFPEDIIRAETATNGDIEILTREEFQEIKKESYANLFGDATKRTPSHKRGRSSKSRSMDTPSIRTPQGQRHNKRSGDYKVHILVQGSKLSNQSEEGESRASTSRAESTEVSDNSVQPETPTNKPVVPPTTVSTSGVYSCHACPFTTSRLNIMIHHNKTHSATYIPYTPTPVHKKPTKVTPKSTKSASKTPKSRKVRKVKTEFKVVTPPQASKRAAEDKTSGTETKKVKTDEEIKSSLLADWDDVEDESPEEALPLPTHTSPDVPVTSESDSVTATVESAPEVFGDAVMDDKSSSEKLPTVDKPNSSRDSKYEFCEDEDWPLETDGGRKIPRVKNSSRKRADVQSGSIDDDDVAREVAELLVKTTVPEIPSVPESLKVEENFPELPIAKSPDKILEKCADNMPGSNNSQDKTVSDVQQTKTIFKTKTFFRSRHSRSQDAIGKYVAEQLNAAERMDASESEINGTESMPSPERRESPPADHVKVARLAPKIQLKKMKAEAQLKEKSNNDPSPEDRSQTVISPLDHTDVIDCRIVDKKQLHEIDTVEEAKSSDDKLNDENNCNQSNLTTENNIKINPQLKSKDEEPNELYELNPQLKSKDEEPIELTEINPQLKCKDEKPIELSESNPQLKSKDEEPIELSEINPQLKSKDDEPNELFVLDQQNLEIVTPNADIGLPEKSKNNIDEHYMNETTASAVDALLSVSREADRVTKTISNDLPEDLFEDDNKDNSNMSDLNGFHNDTNANNDDLNRFSLDHIPEQITNEVEVEESKKEIEKSDELVAESEDQDIKKELSTNDVDMQNKEDAVDNSAPPESVLQIAETLINLPSTAVQSKMNEDSPVNVSNDNCNIEQTVGSSVEINADNDIEISESEHTIYGQDTVEDINNFEFESETIITTNDGSLDVPTDGNTFEDPVNNGHFESEQEKSDNLNAAQCLVQMSETVDHNAPNVEINVKSSKSTNLLSIEDETASKSSKIQNHNNTVKETAAVSSTVAELTSTKSKFDHTQSKLLKILEEPCKSKPVKATNSNILSQKKLIVHSKEKILNFDVSKSPFKTAQSPNHKIVIRRTNPSKTLISCLSDTSQEKIVLSRSNKLSSSVPTYTIQATPEISNDSNTIFIQQKLGKVSQTPTKLQKTKPQTSLVNLPSKAKKETTEDALFDINSMPIVLSDDILTPESIEKLPIVMTDVNVMPTSQKQMKAKPTYLTDNQKIMGGKSSKTLLVNSLSESTRPTTTPNIISKASKMKSGAKTMLLVDKFPGKQHIILPKSEVVAKTMKIGTSKAPLPAQQTVKSDKLIILPENNTPRATRPQKIMIDPQSGKAQMVIGEASEPAPGGSDNKPVSAKLMPVVPEAGNPGGTVMIITDAQGTQSRILLTSEHEKLLFPNKQQKFPQIKTVSQRPTILSATTVQKLPTVISAVPQIKTQTRITPRQKNTIITSKGQLIMGSRVAPKTVQSVTTLQEIRPAAPKRIIVSEANKMIQTVQKANKSEPLIFLQQKPGTVMQLTAEQFEHMQRTGQIPQKTGQIVQRAGQIVQRAGQIVHRTPVQMQPVLQESKIIVQKTVTIASSEPVVPATQKQRGRAPRPVSDAPPPPKKPKPREIASPPSLAPLQSTSMGTLTKVSSAVTPPTAQNPYPDLENFEELLPSTAIARQPELQALAPQPAPEPTPPAAAPAAAAAAPPAQLADGQLLAVPGEHFGGPQGSFYLCVEDNGCLTPIDNRPLMLDNNQLVPMPVVEAAPASVLPATPERRDILEAALANSDVFHADVPRDDAPDFRDLNVNVSAHCRVSETSTTLNQPIMTPVEVPSKAEADVPALATNLEDGLAVIGVTAATVPTSLDLPITVTDPRIAPKTTDPLSGAAYGATLLPSPGYAAPISMPLLTEEEDGVGKSMPILTDEVTERTASSVESTVDSPSSLEVREAELEEGGNWSRRLLTPGSDTSDNSANSAEIPLQPTIQLSAEDLNRNS